MLALSTGKCSVTSYYSFMLYRGRSRKAHEEAASMAAAASRERGHTEHVAAQHRETLHCLPASDLGASVPVSSLSLNIT